MGGPRAEQGTGGDDAPHAAILASPNLRTTGKAAQPRELDVSPMDNPAIKPLEFTLVMSATQFETKEKGLFPPSLV